MANPFYNDEAPMPFRGVFEEEPEVPGKKRRKVLFTGGLLGPMGYPGASMYPFIMGPVEDLYEEEEDPNP